MLRWFSEYFSTILLLFAGLYCPKDRNPLSRAHTHTHRNERISFCSLRFTVWFTILIADGHFFHSFLLSMVFDSRSSNTRLWCLLQKKHTIEIWFKFHFFFFHPRNCVITGNVCVCVRLNESRASCTALWNGNSIVIHYIRIIFVVPLLIFNFQR